MSHSSINCRRLLEIVLSVVLLQAAVMKLGAISVQGGHFAAVFVGGFVPLKFVVACEFTMGTWLLVSGLSRPRFYSSIICFSLLVSVAAYETAQASPTCGCFGTVQFPAAMTAVFDASAVVALWLTRPRNAPLAVHDSANGLFATAVVTIGGIFIVCRVASASHNSEKSFVDIDPAELVNRAFPFANEINGSERLELGRWLLVFYHYDCDECLEAIPAYRRLAISTCDNLNQPRVAFIAIPPFAPKGKDPVLSSPDFLHLRLRQDHEWIVTTPVVVALQDGRVLAAVAGNDAIIPSLQIPWHH